MNTLRRIALQLPIDSKLIISIPNDDHQVELELINKKRTYASVKRIHIDSIDEELVNAITDIILVYNREAPLR